MKKVLMVALVAFALLAIGGTASAWIIDLDGWNSGVDLELSIEVEGALDDYNDDEVYKMTTTLGIDGQGYVDIDGSSCGDDLDTDVWNGKGTFYATQTMEVWGDLEECDCEQPDYYYAASQGALIDGRGNIDLDQNVDAYDCADEHQQFLDVCGVGDFEAGMSTYSEVDWCCEPVIEQHVMGAFGSEVKFTISGHTEFNEMYGDASGEFEAWLRFRDCGCDDDDDCC